MTPTSYSYSYLYRGDRRHIHEGAHPSVGAEFAAGGYPVACMGVATVSFGVEKNL